MSQRQAFKLVGDRGAINRATEVKRALPLHLKRLEAESIEIMREVVAEYRSPVMLYPIAKDSSVMLHLAIKALYPAKLPFQFLPH